MTWESTTPETPVIAGNVPQSFVTTCDTNEGPYQNKLRRHRESLAGADNKSIRF